MWRQEVHCNESETSWDYILKFLDSLTNRVSPDPPIPHLNKNIGLW